MSEDWPGSLEQQSAVREALKVEFGSPQHKLLQKVDREVNRRGQHYLPVAFVDLPWLGRGFATGILLRDILNPVALGGILQHEFGHTYEQLDLLTQDDKTWFMGEMSTSDRDWTHFAETFADAFRDWFRGISWQTLTPRLIRGVGDE